MRSIARGCKVLLTATLLTFPCMALPLAAQADLPGESGKTTSITDLADFRETFLTLAILLDGVSSSGTLGLERGVEQLTDEELRILYDVYPDRQAFAARVESMVKAFLTPTPAKPFVEKGYSGVNRGAFTPGYPVGSSYDTLTATLPGFGLLSDSSDPDSDLNNERCDANGEAEALIVAKALEAAGIAAQALCDSIIVALGNGTNTAACVAAGIAHAATFAAEVVVDQCAYQDASVDGAELEAAYENSLALLEAVTCRVDPVLQGRRGNGCNEQDDNCDGFVDRDEDHFAPEIQVDTAVFEPWYRSVAEAIAAASEATQTTDDCDCKEAFTQDDVVFKSGSCGSTILTARARDFSGNLGLLDIEVRVDGDPPAVSCATVITEIDDNNGAMVDVGFSFSVPDNCDSDPAVRVAVMSNEPSGSADPDALLRHDSFGDVTGILLRAERDANGSGRIYQIRVEATDESGLTGVGSCDVVVPPPGKKPVIDTGERFAVIF